MSRQKRARRASILEAMVCVSEMKGDDLSKARLGRIVLPGETVEDDFESRRSDALGIKDIFQQNFQTDLTVSALHLGRASLEASVAALQGLEPVSWRDVRRFEINGIIRDVAPYVAALAALLPKHSGSDLDSSFVRSEAEQVSFVRRHPQAFVTLLDVANPTGVAMVDSFAEMAGDYLSRITVVRNS